MVHKIQKRVGNQWVAPEVKIRTNGQWATPRVSVRENGKWSESILEKRVVETWNATWTQSYDGGNNKKPAGSTLGRLYQGRYNEYDPGAHIWHNPVWWHRQRSMIGFNVQDIQRKLNGRRIEKVELYLHIQHAWYGSGATATIGTHGYASEPHRYDNVHYALREVKYGSRNEGRWIDFSTEIGRDLASGKVSGFTLHRESDNLQFYGYWHGMGSPVNLRPKLRITYYSSATDEPVVIPKPTPKYTRVLRGEGLVQVTERLMRQGLLSQDFFVARATLVRLNNFSTSAPVLHPDQLIMYHAGG